MLQAIEEFSRCVCENWKQVRENCSKETGNIQTVLLCSHIVFKIVMICIF